MKRREFLYVAGSVAALAPFLTTSCAGSSSKQQKLKMGLQLFTIRDFMEKDPIVSLKKVMALGYGDLETYGFDPNKKEYYGYNTKDLKNILMDLGMSTPSGHYDLANYIDASADEMRRYVDQCIEGAIGLGQSYITWPWLPPEHRNIDGFKSFAGLLNKIGEQVNQSELGFAYHNHGYDMEDLNGQTGFDIITKETDSDLVKFQLDMYWSVFAGVDPVKLVSTDPSRFVMWHIKDMDKVTRDYSEMGNGSIDYVPILSQIPKEGLEFYFIEQGGNFEVNSMQSVETSTSFFNKNLRHLI